MNLIQKNDYGRVYVDEFTVSKIIYRYLKQNYQHIEVIKVVYSDNELTIKISNSFKTEIQNIEQLQSEAQNLIKDKLGFYVQNLNVVVG